MPVPQKAWPREEETTGQTFKLWHADATASYDSFASMLQLEVQPIPPKIEAHKFHMPTHFESPLDIGRAGALEVRVSAAVEPLRQDLEGV
jgi:hypothetical protein